jgi:hypothetical protein
LLLKVDEARAATMVAQAAVMEAQNRLNEAMSKEMRLYRQLDQNNRRAGEAIAVEERGIEEQETEEFLAELELPPFEPAPWDDRLMMSPSGWAAFNRGVAGPGLNPPEAPDSQPDPVWEVVDPSPLT